MFEIQTRSDLTGQWMRDAERGDKGEALDYRADLMADGIPLDSIRIVPLNPFD